MNLLPDSSTLLLQFRDTVQGGKPPLRVAVVIDTPGPGLWVEALVTHLAQVPGLAPKLLTLGAKGKAEEPGIPWLTDRFVRYCRAKSDPLAAAEGGAAATPVSGPAQVAEARFDVVIWLAPVVGLTIEPRQLASHSVLSVQMGDSGTLIPFWNDVAAGKPSCLTTVFLHDDSFSKGRAVRKAQTSVLQGMFVTQNAEEPALASVSMLAGLCVEIRAEPALTAEKFRLCPEQRLDVQAVPAWPTNQEAARFIASKLARSARLWLRSRGKEKRWITGFRRSERAVTDHADGLLTGFRDVPLPTGSKEMADPFLWQAGGRSYLFFEEVPFASPLGRLGFVEILDNGSFSDMTILLEREYHLSYPCIVQSSGDAFLMPETSDTGRVDLYRFSRFPDRIELVSTLVEGLPLVDTTPLLIDGKWYFFTTTIWPFMETLLFSSDRLDGPWALHPASPISGSVENSRSAGQIFRRNGKLYRPTQDCSVRYGYAMQINEITRLTPTEFEERKVNWVGPSWRAGLLGTHTWAECGGLQAIDGIVQARIGDE